MSENHYKTIGEIVKKLNSGDIKAPTSSKVSSSSSSEKQTEFDLAGGSIGGALALWHIELNKDRKINPKDDMKGSYLGPEYSQKEGF